MGADGCLLQEKQDKEVLQAEVRHLRKDNRWLQDESQSAAAQLRKFTEWFFSTFDRSPSPSPLEGPRGAPGVQDIAGGPSSCAAAVLCVGTPPPTPWPSPPGGRPRKGAKMNVLRAEMNVTLVSA